MPGVKLNFNKDSISVTAGTRGAHYTVGTKGEQITVGIPGTGISYSERRSNSSGRKMSTCPNCGHRMRKQWDNCPKCKYPLTVEAKVVSEASSSANRRMDSSSSRRYTSISEQAYHSRLPIGNDDSIVPTGQNLVPTTSAVEVTASTNNGGDGGGALTPSQPQEKSGCSPRLGCLGFIIFFLFLAFACSSSPKTETKKHNATPVKQEQIAQPIKKETPKEQDNKTKVVPVPVPIPVATTAPASAQIAESKPVQKQDITPYEERIMFVANTNTGKIHAEGCRYASRIKAKNRATFKGKTAARNSGYTPCKVCRPF